MVMVMNEALIEILESGRCQIVRRWAEVLEANLSRIWGEPAGIPQHIVQGVLDELIVLLGFGRDKAELVAHQPLSLPLGSRDRSKIPWQLEVMLSGDEVVEDFLTENAHRFHIETGPSHCLEEVHRAFHVLILKEINGFCGNCVQPLVTSTRHIVDMVRGAPTSTEAT